MTKSSSKIKTKVQTTKIKKSKPLKESRLVSIPSPDTLPPSGYLWYPQIHTKLKKDLLPPPGYLWYPQIGTKLKEDVLPKSLQARRDTLKESLRLSKIDSECFRLLLGSEKEKNDKLTRAHTLDFLLVGFFSSLFGLFFTLLVLR